MKLIKFLLSITIAILDITLSVMLIRSLSEDDDLTEYRRSGD